MSKKNKQKPPDLCELKLTDREALIIDALIFNTQCDRAYLGKTFRNIYGEYEQLHHDDIAGVGTVFFRLSRFLRDSVR